MKKRYTVLATFPSLPAARAQQAATAEAASLPTAVSRALQTILRRPAVKGRRIEALRLSVTVNGKVAEDEES